ncbi:hypothetical protein JHK82_027821 [Glycine max]|nr:hypothetical protein JHK82_027821 [Glycine max]
MFQKFALVFKTKTFEFFSKEENNASPLHDDIDNFSLLDSTVGIPSSFASTVVAKVFLSSSLESCELETPPLLPLTEAQIREMIAIPSHTIFPSGWDLGLAANVVHPNVDYAMKGHNQYTRCH